MRKLNCTDLDVDSKIVYAIRYLFWDDIASFIPPREGFNKCDPIMCKNKIKILFYEEEIGRKVAEEIERFI